MRKLKAFLILLFAAAMSFTLFACGGGDETGGSSISSVTISSVLELTDSDEADDFKTALENYSLSVRDSATATNIKIKGSDCDVTGEPGYHKVGMYTVTLTPKENNPDHRSGQLTVRIVHDFGAPNAKGVETCAYDGATRSTKSEDVALHYAEFHYGTGIDANYAWTVSGSEDKLAQTGIPDGVQSTASSPSGIDEHFNHAVYNDDMSGDGDTTATSRIQPFGQDSSGKEVPTVTAGRLMPGMSITIKGWAKTDVGTTSPYGTYNDAGPLNYSAPSYGIADRYYDIEKDGYDGGSSVIVRSEGWVLYDGIGQSPNRTLAGLPKVVGANGNGANDGANYGSHKSAQGSSDDNAPLGYPADRVMPAHDAWKDWWVFSEGTNLNSSANYLDWTEVEVTWSYSIGNDGVGIIQIESIYDVNGKPSTLTSYIRVPKATRGYYDTIIHGDISSLLITESSVIETETVAAVSVNGVKEGARSAYLAGQQIDVATTVNVTYTTSQSSTPSEYPVDNSMLYYYTGETQALENAVADLADNEKWTVVGDSPLAANMKFFKIEFERSDTIWRGLIYNEAKNGSGITVTDTNVKEAFGYDYAGYPNNSKVGDAVLTVGENSATRITLTGASVQKNGSDYYIALKLVGLNAFGEVNAAVSSPASGVTVEATKDDDDVLLLVKYANKEATASVVITGIQTQPVEIVLVDPIGFEVTSTVNKGTDGWQLNKGGEVTFTYTFDSSAIEFDSIEVAFNNNTISLSKATLDGATLGSEGFNVRNSGLYLMTYSATDGQVQLKFKFPAYDFAKAAEMPVVTFYGKVNGGSAQILAQDTVEYAFGFADGATETGVNFNGVYVYADSNNLYLVKAVAGNIDYKNAAYSINSLPVIINNGGEVSDVTYLALGYSYDRALEEFAFLNKVPDGITIAPTAFGTADNAKDKDLGALIVITIDVKAVTGIDGAYSFQVAPGESEEHYYTANNGKITENDVGTAELELVREGTCYTTGIVARLVKNNDNVVFYANYREVGGAHVDGNKDGNCDLCGGKITANDTVGVDKAGVWFPEGHPSIDIEEGDIITFTGKYADNIGETGYGSVLAVFIEEADGSGWDNAGNDEKTNGTWHTTQDGYAVWTNFGWNANRWPSAPEIEGYDHQSDGYDRFTSSAITAEHPYNTANGWVNAYGTTLDETNFNAAKQGGTFRFVVTRLNGKITTVAQLWAPNMVAYTSEPFFEYSTEVTTISEAGRYTVKIFGKQQNDNKVKLDGGISVTTAKVESSVISGASGASVSVKYNGDGTKLVSGTDIDYTVKGATITAVGMASNLTDKLKSTLGITGDATHYVAFDISFSQQLVQSTTLVLKDANGAEVKDGSYTAYLKSENKISVVLLLKKGEKFGKYVLDLTNFEASSMQSDITIDLTGIAASDTVLSSKDISALDLGESDFTLTYNAIPAGAKLSVNGGEAKTIAANADLGSGLKVKTLATNTVTITKAAADLTKVLPGYEIRLYSSDDVLLHVEKIAPVITLESDVQNEIESTGWHYQVGGTSLILYSTATTDGTLNLTVNAGKATDPELLNSYDLSFKLADGKMSFKNANNLTAISKTVYTASGSSGLAVIVIDLKTLGVASATVKYGFASTSGGKYYTVDGTSVQDHTNSSAEKATLREATCADTSIKAYSEGTGDAATFYYGIEIGAKLAHTWVVKSDASEAELKGYDEIYTCTNACNCGSIKYVRKNVTDQVWDAQQTKFGEGGSIWSKYGTITKGSSYTVVGINLADGKDEFELNSIGISAKDTGDGHDPERAVRGSDGWNFDLPAAEGYGTSVVKFETITAATELKEKLNNVEVTFTVEYLTTNELVITCEVDAVGKVITTIPLTKPANLYHLYFHPDGNKYTVSETAYVAAKGTEPVHVHQYDETTHRCPDDGAVDPAHTEHVYDKANPDGTGTGTNFCVCGSLNPEHTHAYVDGACRYCKAVGTSNLGTAGFYESDYKSGTLVNDNFNLAQPAHDDAEITIGQTLIIVGTVASPEINDNFDTVSWEIEEGWTQRADNYGWLYAESGITVTSKVLAIYDKAAKESAVDWAVMKDIAKAANYRIEIKFVSATKIEGTVSITATAGDHAGYTYVNTVELTSPKELTTLHTHIGMRDGTITMLGYKKV